MENFTAYIPTKVHFGKDVTDQLGISQNNTDRKSFWCMVKVPSNVTESTSDREKIVAYMNQ